MDNGPVTDPYASVLADLQGQKQKIEEAIALLESLRGGPVVVKSVGNAAGTSNATAVSQVDWGPGAFLGMSIVDATKKLLHAKRQPMRTVDIVSELEGGGLVLNSSDKVNTVGSILLRRFYQVEDIVRQGRGVWGLAEWHPGRKFPKGGKPTGGQSKGEHTETREGEVGNAGTETRPSPTFEALMGSSNDRQENPS